MEALNRPDVAALSLFSTWRVENGLYKRKVPNI